MLEYLIGAWPFSTYVALHKTQKQRFFIVSYVNGFLHASFLQERRVISECTVLFDRSTGADNE